MLHIRPRGAEPKYPQTRKNTATPAMVRRHRATVSGPAGGDGMGSLTPDMEHNIALQ